MKYKKNQNKKNKKKQNKKIIGINIFKTKNVYKINQTDYIEKKKTIRKYRGIPNHERINSEKK